MTFPYPFKNDSKLMVFGFPVYGNTYKELICNIKNVYYPIYSIEFRDNSINKQYLTKIYENNVNIKRAVFCVKPDITVDIYKLYCNAYIHCLYNGLFVTCFVKVQSVVLSINMCKVNGISHQ